jgi:site-specific recombinase XerD
MTLSTRVNALTSSASHTLPALINQAGEEAQYRFIEFFTATIRNPNTRRAYHTAISQFFSWAHSKQLTLDTLNSIHIATYVESLQRHIAAPTVKQHLAAIRSLFDWLVTGQILAINPAHPVRGPRHQVTRGKTPILSAEETRLLLDSIPTDNVMGLRDRALIALMVYSFARIGAALAMEVQDYYPNGKRWWIRLHEKGGKYHEMPAHHQLEQYLDQYIQAAGLVNEPSTPLFRTFKGNSGVMTQNAMRQVCAWNMVRRRAEAAGIKTPICNHSFRGTGITTYLSNGGTLEKAQQMAAHESPRTTKLYDRTSDEISVAEIERIII